jgi:hypothetical protein
VVVMALSIYLVRAAFLLRFKGVGVIFVTGGGRCDRCIVPGFCDR